MAVVFLKAVDIGHRVQKAYPFSSFPKAKGRVGKLGASSCIRIPTVVTPDGEEEKKKKKKMMMIIGHRGNGMNILNSDDKRMSAFKENSLLSFNKASSFPIDFIEFDVQVTKDECPVIFHDNFILSRLRNGTVFEKRITELSLSQLLSYGPQKHSSTIPRPLLRKTDDGGGIVDWNVRNDDSLCTLQEAFQTLQPSLGFNIELKFDDHLVYQHDRLLRVLQSILHVVLHYAHDRPIIFSTFLPDAAILIRQLQTTYPVFFLTEGGSELYNDARRNSLEEALKLCLENNLQGIVSEVDAIFRNPGMIEKIKDSQLSLLTYGKLNNVAKAVYMQHLMGVEGVVVDLVEEITEAMSELIANESRGRREPFSVGKGEMLAKKPQLLERGNFHFFKSSFHS